jgi:hypothetical protein
VQQEFSRENICYMNFSRKKLLQEYSREKYRNRSFLEKIDEAVIFSKKEMPQEFSRENHCAKMVRNGNTCCVIWSEPYVPAAYSGIPFLVGNLRIRIHLAIGSTRLAPPLQVALGGVHGGTASGAFISTSSSLQGIARHTKKKLV